MSSITDRLERLPFSRFHRRLLLLGGLGYAFDAMDQASIAFVLPVVSRLWHLTSVQTGTLGSATYIGFFFGALNAGLAADRWGRKFIMMTALAIYAAASAASAMVESWPAFFMLRIVAGYGVGAESVVIAPFLAEFVASRYRGRFTGALAGFFSFGFIGAALIGVAIVPSWPSGWRVAIGLTALPVVMLLVWRRSLPESPKWLESQGRHAEAAHILATMEHEIPGRRDTPPPPERTAGSGRTDGLRDLWRAPQRRATILASALWFTVNWTYYAYFTWLPSLLLAGGASMQTGYNRSLLIYSAQIPGYFVVAAVIDRIGRKRALGLCLGFGGLSALAFGLAHGSVETNLCGLLLSFFLNGCFAGLYVYTPELFPTVVRTTGQGLASAVGRLGAIASPMLVGFMLPRTGFAGVFAMLGSVLLLGAAAVWWLGLETAGQRLHDALAAPDGNPDGRVPLPSPAEPA
ncbi:MFS transporter [Gluconacetobacter azotocaptans]|uniref:MFS transporter n=1 Tax=Gluconacetobacter azotocaptans TaxID=142834 RepID=UPI00195D0C94|nr:MFS transporter [Gluconacetobacter azotocaptans]MBM9400757.1 MFS transporter [Gluconacetobacter azotocaptans]